MNDPYKAVSYTHLFAGAGCPLLMLNTNRASLEEIFLELTQGETGPKLLSAKREEEKTDAGDL